MRSRRRQVVVEVSPTRRQLTLFEQESLIGHRVSEPSEPSSDWAAVLRSLEAELPAWVRELDVSGEPAVVLYAGPDTTASLFEAPVSAGESRARQAARLAMADTTAFPLEENAHEECCLFRDGSGRAGEQPKIRTLAVADTESTILSLSMVVEQAGLSPKAFVPTPGATLTAAVDELRRGASPGSPRVVLWLGENASVVAGGEGDRLHFARLIHVGTEMLVEAIAGPVGTTRADHAVALDRRSARELLLVSGIPSPDGWPDAATAIDPGAILPLLQPVLQRWVVETKQSIRFGFAAETRPTVVLGFAGPGSRIAGLGEAIAAGVGVAPDTRHCQPAQDFTRPGDLAAMVASGRVFPSLATREASARQAARSSRSAIAIGAALAMTAMGMHAAESWQRLGEAERTLSTLSGDSDSSATAALHSTVAARLGVTYAQTARQAQLGSDAPGAAMLRALASLTPEGVAITEINMIDDQDAARVTIRGTASADSTMSDSERFSAFTAALGACPLIAETALGETRRSTGDGEQTLSFNLSLRAVRFPAGVTTAAVQPEEGQTP